jgi:hypothetical protein
MEALREHTTGSNTALKASTNDSEENPSYEMEIKEANDESDDDDDDMVKVFL